MISWWWSLPRESPSTTSSLFGERKVRITLLSSSVLETVAFGCNRFPILFSCFSYSATASAVIFFCSAIFSSIDLDYAISSSHLSCPLLSFFFWATTLEIAFFSLFKLSRAYLARRRWSSWGWLTCSGNLVKLDDFVHKGHVCVAFKLGLAHNFRITACKITQW